MQKKEWKHTCKQETAGALDNVREDKTALQEQPIEHLGFEKRPTRRRSSARDTVGLRKQNPSRDCGYKSQ